MSDEGRLRRLLADLERSAPMAFPPPTQPHAARRSAWPVFAAVVIAGVAIGVLLAGPFGPRKVGQLTPSPSPGGLLTPSPTASTASRSPAPSASPVAAGATIISLTPGGNGVVTAATRGPRGFVALGRRAGAPAAWHSADGRTWSGATTPGSTETLQATAAAGSDLGYVAAVATCGPSECAGAAFWSSSDGARWVTTATRLDGRIVVDIVVTNGGFLAIAGTWPGDSSQQPMILRSVDGRGWQAISPAGSGLTGANVTAMAVHRGQIVAVGSQLQAVGSTPSSWTSTDGLVWTRHLQSSGWAAAMALQSDGERLITVGMGPCASRNACAELDLAWSSSDGLTWQPYARSTCCQQLWRVAPAAPGWLAVANQQIRGAGGPGFVSIDGSGGLRPVSVDPSVSEVSAILPGEGATLAFGQRAAAPSRREAVVIVFGLPLR